MRNGTRLSSKTKENQTIRQPERRRSFISSKLKENVHIEIQGFKFLIERTPSDHVWVSVEYDYYDAYTMDDVTYTSVIAHIDDID